jgi:hypothetical protein
VTWPEAFTTGIGYLCATFILWRVGAWLKNWM